MLIKPRLLLLLSILCLSIPVTAAIRERRVTPLLHSVADTKNSADYMLPNEMPFLPAGPPPHLRTEHRRIVAGRVLAIAGGGAALLGTGLLLTANGNNDSGIVDDVFTEVTRGFGTVLLVAGAIALVIGLILLTEGIEECDGVKTN